MRTALILVILLFTGNCFAQGKSISKAKKIMTPYITSESDTLSVGQEVMLLDGTGTDGRFLYVQLLNGFNEPIQPADSRASSQKQKILFFKEQEGVTYLFTKFFVINIESAIRKGEFKIIRN
jgi:hypothetical protein